MSEYLWAVEASQSPSKGEGSACQLPRPTGVEGRQVGDEGLGLRARFVGITRGFEQAAVSL